MIFTETRLPGAYIVEMEKHQDERGDFARSWCAREFKEHNLDSSQAQCSVSYNRKRGTIRGMHYQIPPFAESKLVRCTRGAMLDVIIDVRPISATFTQWISVELTPESGIMLFVPPGFAHGFQTLMDDTEVFYHISEFYSPAHQRGVRWDDPAIGITWPQPVTAISESDCNHPDLDVASLCQTMKTT